MDLESDSCSCEIVKVELVNKDTLQDKITEKVILAVAGGLITLFLEKGISLIAKQVVEIKRRKLEEETQKLIAETN